MSTYTTQLRYIVESGYDLGLKNYPIFDEGYRELLNAKIIEHYYFREIGLETAGLFKRFLNRKMAEIMPYYNQLYKSELLKVEPLTRIDLWETFKRSDNGEFNGTMQDNTNNFNVYSDTPQGNLSTADIKDHLYASSASKDQNEQHTSTNQTTENQLEHEKHNYGNPGTRTDSEMLLEYRKTFLNIDMMVINELEELFMQLW